MEFFKYLWVSFVTILTSSFIAIFRSEILAFFHLDSGRIPLSILSYILFGIGIFEVGRKWDSFFDPIVKFKRFLDKKIKQGEKLYKKKEYESLVTRKIPVDPPITAPNGEVLKEQMDYSQTDKFRNFYRKWKEQVFAGLKHGLGKKAENEFNDSLPISATFNSMADMRTDLLKDLEYLIKKQHGLKRDMLDPNFNPKFLKDYLDLEGL